MKTLSVAQVKEDLSRLMDQVVRTDEEIVITRNGRAVAILISADECEGWNRCEPTPAEAAGDQN